MPFPLTRSPRHPRAQQLLSWSTLGLGWLLAACSASVDADPSELSEEAGATRALIRVERTATVDGSGLSSANPEGLRASALARFATVSSASPERVLSLLDLSEDLPEPGRCFEPAVDTQPSLAALGRVELLEAGDVSVSAADQTTLLAPRAFPTVKDLVSGVVYSTRDQAAEPLPEGALYRVWSSGSLLLPPIDVSAEAPEGPADVLIGGTPLAELSSLELRAPASVSWTPSNPPGNANDLLLFELSDGVSSVVCSFEDRAGSGTVPQAALQGSGLSVGSATLSVHRVRVIDFTSDGIDQGELRFDFEVASRVRVSYGSAE